MISVSIGCFLALFFFGFSFYRVLRESGFFQKTQNQNTQDQNTQNTSDGPARLPTTEIAVEHGNVARPDEFHAHGQLYFVPVGRQVIATESLASYYREKFGIEITVLPQIEVKSSDCIPARRQCVAEEIMWEMRDAYPKIAQAPDSVMIALTDEDIFPRALGWEFTYSLHSDRFAVVSTRRMNPAFWGDPPDVDLRLASTKQMLTKYVAILFLDVPESFDPTSVLYSPLTPDGGADNIYESDLHPEESANGRRGEGWPCLFFKYSYHTHEIAPEKPVLSDCRPGHPVVSTDEETFHTSLVLGVLMQRSMDFRIDSTPGIEFRRAYISNYPAMSLGMGTSHSYDTFLSSDGPGALTYIRINHEDGDQENLDRVSPGRGFNPGVVFEGHDDSDDTYGARMTWDSGHFRLQYRDGAQSTYLPCSDTSCYWTGYQDAGGNTLHFERSPDRVLRALMASDRQGVTFQSDDRKRITEATTTNGGHVSYAYDAAGCLARVRRADGQVTLYQYDSGNHMTSVSVMRKPGTEPETILTNEYDSQGRVVKQTLAGVGSYKLEYIASNRGASSEVKLTDPSGRIVTIAVGQNVWIARTTPVRYHAVLRRTSQAR